MKKTKQGVALLLAMLMLAWAPCTDGSLLAAEVTPDAAVEAVAEPETEVPAETETEDVSDESDLAVQSDLDAQDAQDVQEEEAVLAEEEDTEAVVGARATAADVLKPNSNNKKGIQGTEYAYGATKDADPNSLDINHVLLNVHLSNVISTDGSGVAYNYNGTTYHFNYDNYVKVFEWRARELRAQGKALTFVILMDWSDNPTLQNLIYPGGRVNDGTHYYYGLNVYDPNAKALLDATFHYLADVFGASDTFVQNWIIGNEVNMPTEYNYTGTADKDTNVDICAKSFDLLYGALQDNNPNAKAYISMTHHWTSDNNGTGIPTKDFIDAFAAKEGGKNWNVAFHAYQPNLDESVTSKKSAEWLRHDVGSKYVCGANLEVLTDYVKNNYGSDHRIILSEQGFDSKSGEAMQAAMLAYTYYAAARNDMVDAAIFTTWQDSNEPQFMGRLMGLKDGSGNQRLAYNVFKYMNNANGYVAAEQTNYYLSVLGISNWTDNIIWTPSATGAVLTSGSLYLADQSNNRVMIGMTTATSEPTDLEYRWLAYNITKGIWTVVSDWTLDNEWLVWYPKESGDFLLQGEVRVAGNQASTITQCTGITLHSVIKGKCQMPYEGEGGGYLIGLESYDNPNNSYSYELLVLDCTKLAAGDPAPWIYSSGQQKVPGNNFWVIWQPQYGYYWTLFRVYDANGNLIDEDCYSFQNAY